MTAKQENGLKHLINGTAWMTFAVMGYLVYNLITYRRPAMHGIWPKIADIALVIGIILAIWCIYMSIDGIRTQFDIKNETSLSYRKITIFGIAAIVVMEFISLVVLKQGLTAATILLPVCVVWGCIEASVTQKFYEIDAFATRQTSKTTNLIIGTVIIGIFCAISYPMANVHLAYWLLMIPQLIMAIDMMVLNNILISL
ncbi:MAG: hypothetical protein ACI4W2_12440 [Eubacterium sp.]